MVVSSTIAVAVNVVSEVGEGFADGQARGAGRRRFGGENGAEEDECGPDGGGEEGDSQRQRRVEEEVAQQGIHGRGEPERRDGRQQAAGQGDENAFGDDDAAYRL